MANRQIPSANGGRTRKTSVRREVVTSAYGALSNYGPCPLAGGLVLCTGGTSMTARLGPDLGDGQRRGTPTNSNSLQPVMRLLNANSNKKWKAGHLLNAEFGGLGTQNSNLTPLTAAANNAHRVFEGHIKRMLILCNQIDRAHGDYDEWYGVLYTVTVSALTYANMPATNDMHSYAYSHLTLDYRFIKLPKFPPIGPRHALPPAPNTHTPVVLVGMLADPHLVDLQGVVQPNFAPSVNIANWAVTQSGTRFSVEIHNEP